MSPLLWIVVAGVIVAAIVRRFLGEPLRAKDVFATPLILLGIGLYSLVKAHPAAVDLWWVGVAAVLGVALGAWRASTVRLYPRDGVLWQRYTRATLLVWVVSLVVKLGVGALSTLAGAHHEANPITLSLGVGLLGEMAVLARRALRSGTPFAPDDRDSPLPQR